MMTAITYDQADFLCVGCFGWARAKTAREAFRACKANSSGTGKFRIWRIADQINTIKVCEVTGSWQGFPIDGVTITKDDNAAIIVWECDDKTAVKNVPELPTEEWKA